MVHAIDSRCWPVFDLPDGNASFRRHFRVVRLVARTFDALAQTAEITHRSGVCQPP